MGKNYKIGSPKVTIFGGSGFLGRYLVYLFSKEGWEVKVAVRSPKDAGFLKVYGVEGQISLLKVNILNEKEVEHAVDGSNVVVNCIGILEETRGIQTFNLLHNKFPGILAEISKALSVKRFVQVSSLGADENSTSRYARSKREGEKKILEKFPNAVVLRPSVIFGAEDAFLNRFAKLSIISPIIPIVGGETKFQPVYVMDVARAVIKSATDNSIKGTFEIGGPDTLSFNELISLMLEIIGRRRLVFNFPYGIALIGAATLTFLRKASFNLIPSLNTIDQVKQLRYDNVVGEGSSGIESFGVKTTSLRVVLPQYLWKYRSSGQFNKNGLN